MISTGIYSEADLSARAARKAESRRIVPEPIDPKASYREAKKKWEKMGKGHPHHPLTRSHKKKTDYDRLQVNLSNIEVYSQKENTDCAGVCSMHGWSVSWLLPMHANATSSQLIMGNIVTSGKC